MMLYKMTDENDTAVEEMLCSVEEACASLEVHFLQGLDGISAQDPYELHRLLALVARWKGLMSLAAETEDEGGTNEALMQLLVGWLSQAAGQAAHVIEATKNAPKEIQPEIDENAMSPEEIEMLYSQLDTKVVN